MPIPNSLHRVPVLVAAAACLAAAASGVRYYGLAFWFYLTGLRQVSASVAGSLITLVPVFGSRRASWSGNDSALCSGRARQL